MTTTKESFNLLIIEDDPSEQKLIKSIINNSGYQCFIKFINDGEEAADYISSYPSSEEILDRIHLILLDLNLPKVHGIEVLKTIKKNPALGKIPVIILTTSNNESDINSTYEAGAAGYIRKPSMIDDYDNVIRRVFDYWFSVCLLPGDKRI